MKLGDKNTLILRRFSPHGAYLGDEENEVLLPNKFIRDEAFQIGDSIEVFLYLDNESRPVATTQIPFAYVGQIAILEIKSIVDNGCFLDLGLDKDIFMPSKNSRRFRVGDKVAVVIKLDKSQRLIARLGVKETLKIISPNKYKRFQKLNVLAFEKTPLGIGAVVDGVGYGMLYHNEIFQDIKLPSYIDAYVKNIRKDGKLDLSLHGQNHLNSTTEAIIQMLNNKGEIGIDMNYDSTPESIKETFGVSKKEFKRALSELISQNKIIIKDNRICRFK